SDGSRGGSSRRRAGARDAEGGAACRGFVPPEQPGKPDEAGGRAGRAVRAGAGGRGAEVGSGEAQGAEDGHGARSGPRQFDRGREEARRTLIAGSRSSSRSWSEVEQLRLICCAPAAISPASRRG